MNTRQKTRKNTIDTKYGAISFSICSGTKGHEVRIVHNNNEYGYGYFGSKSNAIKNMNEDIDKLIVLQMDANELINIKG